MENLLANNPQLFVKELALNCCHIPLPESFVLITTDLSFKHTTLDWMPCQEIIGIHLLFVFNISFGTTSLPYQTRPSANEENGDRTVLPSPANNAMTCGRGRG
ncbi:unnamed protein product [Prunus armeniaca]|uniref:Uncharacterized protein n=1 Tax=Prunus armeniaca TaxID=36596 RepID=A0A6J5UNL1_PRUAR|nr:unnamed protein product [Prunus armeniaca]